MGLLLFIPCFLPTDCVQDMWPSSEMWQRLLAKTACYTLVIIAPLTTHHWVPLNTVSLFVDGRCICVTKFMMDGWMNYFIDTQREIVVLSFNHSIVTEGRWRGPLWYRNNAGCLLQHWKLRLRLKRCCTIPHRWSAQAFRTLGLIPPRPVALFWQFLQLPWLLETDRQVGEVKGGLVFPDVGVVWKSTL